VEDSSLISWLVFHLTDLSIPRAMPWKRLVF